MHDHRQQPILEDERAPIAVQARLVIPIVEDFATEEGLPCDAATYSRAETLLHIRGSIKAYQCALAFLHELVAFDALKPLYTLKERRALAFGIRHTDRRDSPRLQHA